MMSIISSFSEIFLISDQISISFFSFDSEMSTYEDPRKSEILF